MVLTIPMFKQFFLSGKCFILAFYYLVWCPSFAHKKIVSSLDDITFRTKWYFIACFVHQSSLVTKKCQKQFVLENRMLLFSMFSICFFCFFVLLLSFFNKNNVTFPSSIQIQTFFCFYWRIIHLIYVISPLHNVTYKQYCFFLYPSTML